MNTPTPASRIPLWLKLTYTAFMAVLIPVYWFHYGLTNFLFFCDVALILTLIGVWTEKPLFVSLAAVGILLPQVLWCVDFVIGLTGHRFTGMTTYMFDDQRSLFLRGLSLFHGWLPFMLLFLVTRIGYDRRALRGWSFTATALCLTSFLFLPAPGSAEVLANPQIAYNVNYVFGMSESECQQWMHPTLYLVAWLAGLITLVYVPTHAILKRVCPSIEP
jgi:hypothetical protein